MITRTESQGARRSVTVPSRLQRAPSVRGDASIPIAVEDKRETLYVHPAAKVVLFTASPTAVRTAWSSGGWQAQSVEGTLPWASRSERVMAVGPLRLYRQPGSVSFLDSGNLVLSFLPKTQCWCVDGVSKFALRLHNLIYRIELPSENDEEKEKVEELKKVLGTIISYEKTPCPFKRGFHVEYPEEKPRMPPRRRSQDLQTKARKWAFEAVWKPDDGVRPPVTLNNGSPPDSSDAEYEGGRDPDSGRNTPCVDSPSYATYPEVRIATKPTVRARVIQANRSASAPVQLSHLSSYRTGPETEPELKEIPENILPLDGAMSPIATPGQSADLETGPCPIVIISEDTGGISTINTAAIDLSVSSMGSPLISPLPIESDTTSPPLPSLTNSESDTQSASLIPYHNTRVNTANTSSQQEIIRNAAYSTSSASTSPPSTTHERNTPSPIHREEITNQEFPTTPPTLTLPIQSATEDTLAQDPPHQSPPSSPPHQATLAALSRPPPPQLPSPPSSALPVIPGPYAHRHTSSSASPSPSSSASDDTTSHLLTSLINILLSPPRDFFSILFALVTRFVTARGGRGSLSLSSSSSSTSGSTSSSLTDVGASRFRFPERDATETTAAGRKSAGGTGGATRGRRSGSGECWRGQMPGGWVESDCDGDCVDGGRVGGEEVVHEHEPELECEDEDEGNGLKNSGSHVHVHVDVDEEDEDDYGVPIGNDTPARKRRMKWGSGGGGGEVDAHA